MKKGTVFDGGVQSASGLSTADSNTDPDSGNGAVSAGEELLDSVYTSLSVSTPAMEETLLISVDGAYVPSSTFTISGTKTAFIAGYDGLTWSNFKSGYGGYYYQNDIIIDAEKCSSISKDNMMCWAGTAANMLYYTGWLLSDTTSEDDVFSVFIDNFTLGATYGGNAYYGIDWYLTGHYTPQSWSSWDIPLSGTGGYFSDEFETLKLSDYLSSYSVTASSFATAKNRLADGYAVGISFGYYNSSGTRTGGHAITMWGVTCDTSLSVSDPNYYTGIIVSDSDDNKNISDPLNAADTLKIISITYDSTLKKYILDPSYAGNNCRMENFHILAPNDIQTPETSSVMIFSSGTLVKGGQSFTGEVISANANNSMFIYPGGTVSRTSVGSGGNMYAYGGTADTTHIYSSGTATVFSGAQANNTIISNGGLLKVSNGGIVSNTSVYYSGNAVIYSGGTANNTMVGNGASMHVSGGTANKVSVVTGNVFVSSGGVVNTLTNTAPFTYIYVRGGTINNATVKARIIEENNGVQPTLIYLSGGTANSTTLIDEAGLLISSGGRANDTVASNLGYLQVFQNGTALDTELASKGKLNIFNGGTASNTVIQSAGYMQVSSGGRHRGTLQLAQGAAVSAYTGGIIDFTVYERSTADTYLINNLSLISGAPTYTITVKSNQSYGTYKLAQGAGNFTGTVTIGTETADYGTITVNGADFIYNNTAYSLDNVNGDLTLTISSSSQVIDSQVRLYSSGTLIRQGKILTGETIAAGANNSMFVYSGGTADSTTVNSYGKMFVSSGGIASSTTITSRGYVYIYNGGIANDTLINSSYGTLIVSSGGTANRTSTVGYGVVSVYGAINSTLMTSGVMYISSGGVANSATVTDASVYVSSGAKANYLSGKGGRTIIYVRTSGSAYKTVVSGDPCEDGSYVPVVLEASGGIVNATEVKYHGVLRVSRGGFASDTICDGGLINVFGSGSAKNVDVSSGGLLRVWGEEYAPTADDYPEALRGSVTDVTIYRGGTAYISGGEVTDMLVSSGGSAYIGGIADVSATDVYGILYNGEIKSGGSLTIGSGGVEFRQTLVLGGTVTVNNWAYVYADVTFDLSERTVNDTYIVDNIAGLMMSDFGSYSISVAANQADGTYILAGNADDFNYTVSIGSGATAYGDLTVGGTALAYNGKTYSLTRENSILRLNIAGSSQPTGSQVKVYSSGTLVKQGKVLTGEEIISGANNSMFVSSGGTANSTTVSSGGYIVISSGGVASSTTLINPGSATSSCGMVVCSGGKAVNTVLTGDNNSPRNHTAVMKVLSGASAQSTTVNRNAWLVASRGSYVTDTTVTSGGFLSVFGATVDAVTLTVDGGMFVQGKSTATNISAAHGANLKISIAPNTYIQGVYAGSAFEVKDGKISNYTVHDSGAIHISSGGITNSTTLLGGNTWSAGAEMHGYNGGTANNTAVSSGGRMYFSTGFTANRTTAFQSGYVYVSGTANDNVINGGIMNIHKNGVASNTVINTSGRMSVSSGGTHRGTLTMANNAVVSAYAGGTVDFTVSERKTTDGYLINNLSLIKGAPTYTITVDSDQSLGTYKLAQGAGDFTGTLTIGNGTIDYGSITVNGNDLVYDGTTYSLDKVGGDLTLTIGKGSVVDNTTADDLDANGLADTVLIHTGQGYSGAWLTTGDKTIIKWEDLSFVTNDIEMLGTGKLCNSEDDGKDIYFTDGKSVGAWNVVDGKVTGYRNIMNVNATTDVLGLGDFNGDGYTDILLRSTSGDLGFHGTDGSGWNYLKGLGDEWEIAAVGDLNGDGMDDVVLRHEFGFAGTFVTRNDGTVKWENLDTLSSNMTIVGTGDFNGDGVDDVLLQKDDGWIGAWIVEDGSVDSFIGICNNKNTIEQIADFNGDGIDDLRIRTMTGDIGVLYVNGADDTSWQYFQSVGKEWETKFSALA